MSRSIPVRIVLTDYQPYTNIAEHIEAELAKNDLTVLQTKLKRLVAFKEMTFTGKIPNTNPARSLCSFFILGLAGRSRFSLWTGILIPAMGSWASALRYTSTAPASLVMANVAINLVVMILCAYTLFRTRHVEMD